MNGAASFVERFLAFRGPDGATRMRQWQSFSYSAPPFLNVAAAATATDDIPIQSDSDFLAFDLNVTVNDQTTPETVIQFPAVTIQIFDTGSGRSFFNQAAHVNNVAGNAQRPGSLFPFRMVRGGSSLQVQVTNLDAANAIDVRVSLVGIKVFPTNI